LNALIEERKKDLKMDAQLSNGSGGAKKLITVELRRDANGIFSFFSDIYLATGIPFRPRF
jgi:hypothetical protein